MEAELADVCNDILSVLDQHLIPSAQAGESKVFYHKMCVFTPPECPAHADLVSAAISGRETTTATLPSSLPATPGRVSDLHRILHYVL